MLNDDVTTMEFVITYPMTFLNIQKNKQKRL